MCTNSYIYCLLVLDKVLLISQNFDHITSLLAYFHLVMCVLHESHCLNGIFGGNFWLSSCLCRWMVKIICAPIPIYIWLLVLDKVLPFPQNLDHITSLLARFHLVMRVLNESHWLNGLPFRLKICFQISTYAGDRVAHNPNIRPLLYDGYWHPNEIWDTSRLLKISFLIVWRVVEQLFLVMYPRREIADDAINLS